MTRLYILFITFASLLLFNSCIVNESEFENIDKNELSEAGIDLPFEARTLRRDETGRIIVNKEILRREGYEFLSVGDDSWIRKIKFKNNEFKFDYPQYHTYLFDDYFVVYTGNGGFEAGLWSFLFLPRFSELIVFKRESFEFMAKKKILGRVLNVKLRNQHIYFTRKKDGKTNYGRFPLTSQN